MVGDSEVDSHIGLLTLRFPLYWLKMDTQKRRLIEIPHDHSS